MSESPSENRNGKVVTFYSYKGGTGRTMALANVAWILAANGKRVLVADWDLESPGLHRFFSPFLDAKKLDSTTGVIDIVRDYEWAATRESRRDTKWFAYYADVRRHVLSLRWSEFPAGAALDFLAAGKLDRDYAAALAGMNWDDFYERLGGGQFLEALRSQLQYHYDYALIDSRTGLSDVADVCTMLLPDILVDCFTFSEQGITGAAQVAQAVAQFERRDIRILPVPMRVDPAEKNKADAGRQVAKQRFAGLPAGFDAAARDRYWAATQVPYQAFYAYEEVLATFGDAPGAPGTLLAAYEDLAGHITDAEITALPPMDDNVRLRIRDRFERKVVPTEDAVTLRYEPEDMVWAEWIAYVLATSGVLVHHLPTDGGPAAPEQPGRELMIVSAAYAAGQGRENWPAGAPAPLAVYVAEVPEVQRLASSNAARIAGVREEAAIDLLLKLVGRSDAKSGVLSVSIRPRFPGSEPVVFNVPGRNQRFTGREANLRELRSRLLGGGPTGMRLVALQGMGGIGKTQVAMEYAHRFRSAYDIVWWIVADQVAFIDVRLGDLGVALSMPARTNAAENARIIRQSLSRGEPYKRWLLILDNAEDPEKVAGFLPQGTGHVLITSRNPAWADRASALTIDVFKRRESVDHLVKRVPSLTGDEAGVVAERLGDLPAAIAAAGALLSETGRKVTDYLQEIDRTGPKAIDSPVSEQVVAATWDVSLERLRERSQAAYRLLQLFSVMAPEVSLDLVYSDQLAEVLKPIDPSVAEPLVRGSLIQQINRLALLKLDQRTDRRRLGEATGQVIVHRVLQAVVRTRMTDAELQDTQHQVHLVLAASRPESEVDDPATWPRFRQIWPHLEMSDAVRSLDEKVRRLLIDRVRYLYTVGDNVRGLERAEQTEQVWTEALATMPPGEPGTPAAAQRADLLRQLLHLRFNKGNILRDLGRFEESRALNEDVLHQQRALLGTDHPHTLMTAGGLAADLRGLGQYPEALEMDRTTWAAWVEKYGEGNLRTLTALNNLATSLRLMGDFEAALDRDHSVRRGLREILGDTALRTLWSEGLIGRDLREAGEYEQSESLLRNLASSYERTYGPEDRATLNARSNWAISLRSVGRSAEAIEVLAHAYDRLSSIHPTSPETLACRLSLSATYLSLAELKRAEHRAHEVEEPLQRAEQELREVHRIYRDRYGARHPHTLVCINNLAMVIRSKKDYAEARRLAAEAARQLREVLGSDHPYTLAAQTNLAVCSAEGGWADEASVIIDDTLARIRTVLGENHPDTLRCLANQALIERQLHRPKADTAVEDLRQRLGARIGEGHPAVAALREGRYLHRIIDPQPF